MTGRPSGGVRSDDDLEYDRSRRGSDSFQTSSVTRTGRLMSGLPMSTESRHRQERRTREAQREEDSAARTRNGKKPYHVSVNSEGKPYGYGVSVWFDALAKVVRGLDPSYVDIRQQPHHNMEVLMKRLDEDFDYSSPLNPSWLRQRIGNALSSYRHEIIRLIQQEQERPPWLKEAVWEKLVKLEASEKFRTKSSQMKYANACRKNKGKTGPLGVAGITERLRQQLQRTPSPSEVFEEMRRDKGYSGRSRRVKDVDTGNSNADPGVDTVDKMPENSSDDARAQSPTSRTPRRDVTRAPSPHQPRPGAGCNSSVDTPNAAAEDLNRATNESPLIQILERQIRELQSCPHGSTTEYASLILTLQCRLDAMRHFTTSGASNPHHAEEQDVTESHGGDNPCNEAVASTPLEEVQSWFSVLVLYTLRLSR